MERFYNSKRHNMTNYLDIFKSCRLCGSGGGYKMPIIQKLHNDDVIDVEAELKQKIRECVSIDVHPDDRMPPLICELCVDKVNDFYEFREMCRATNARVRASLGLPPQNLSQDVNEDCILGVSGPLFHSSIDNDTSSKKEKLKSNKKGNSTDKKSHGSHEPSPPPALERSSRRRHTDSPLLGSSSKKMRYSSSPSGSPLPERKKHGKGSESLAAEAKRLRGISRDNKTQDAKKGNLLQKQKELLAHKAKEQREARAKEVAAKAKAIQKAKEAAQRAKELKEIQKVKEQKAKDAALKKKQAAAAAAAAVSVIKCLHCTETFSKQTEYRQHVNLLHSPSYTDEKLACTPCGEWFVSLKDADAHHKWHKTSNTYYTCQRCSTDFKVLMGFTKHFQRKQCIPYETVPDVKCNICQGMFATENWMQLHKCPGPPKDMCKRCMSVFQGRVALKRHERRCKGIIVPLNPNNPHLKDLRPLSIAVDRCDDLIRRIKTEPGLLTSFKQEPMDFEESTINIKQEIKQECEDYGSDYEQYGGMDDGQYSSDGSVSETDIRQAPNLVLNPFARKNTTQVDTLSIISLRTIFGGKLLGKRTRRKKKKKNPKLEAMNSTVNTSASADQSAFDSLFSNSDTLVYDSNVENHQTAETVTEETSVDKEHVNNVSSDNNLQIDDPQQVEQPLVNHFEGHDETLMENVLNEIVETTDAQLDGLTDMQVDGSTDAKVGDSIKGQADDSTDVQVDGSTNIQVDGSTDGQADDLTEEPVDSRNVAVIGVGSNELASQADDNIMSASGEIERVSSVDETSSVKSTKTFVEGFALDPEVEALLLEDENISTNTLPLKDTEELDSEISNILHGSIMDKHIIPLSESKEQDVVALQTTQNQTGECDIDKSPNVPNAQTQDANVENVQTHADHDHKHVGEQCENLKENSPVNDDSNENSDEHVGEVISNDVQKKQEGGDGNGNVATYGDTKRPDDVLDLISDSGDDCNIVDSPEKTKLAEDQSGDLVQGSLEADKQIDEESLLSSKDEGNVGDLEITQQDEDMLLASEDVPVHEATASGELHMDQDLEKVSDDEFNLD